MTIAGPGGKSGVYAQGPHNPKLVGLKNGDVLKAGDVAVVEYYLGPLTAQISSSWDMVNFGIYSKELGQIVKISAQVYYS